MKHTALLALVGTPLFLVAPAGFESAASRTADAQERFEPGLLAVDRPAEQRIYSLSAGAYGWVTAVDTTSITVQHRLTPNAPVKFPVCPTLAAGGVRAWYAFFPPYPLADVRVGDLVQAETAGQGKDKAYYEIYIHRRPGGRLGPPSVAPTEKRYNVDYRMFGLNGVGVRAQAGLQEIEYNVEYGHSTRHLYHEWINAFQDYEERGIPLPPDMRPKFPVLVPGGVYLLPDGTLTKWGDPSPRKQPGQPPPHARIQKRRGATAKPVAPMPREVSAEP
jgi:hypothetical protein